MGKAAMIPMTGEEGTVRTGTVNEEFVDVIIVLVLLVLCRLVEGPDLLVSFAEWHRNLMRSSDPTK